MIDPVCGMTVEPARAAGSHTHAGKTFYFCSKHCLERFAAEPARFVAPTAPPETAKPPPGGQWTCPMHPQIVRDGPGSCPICGMALEPRVAAADDQANPELVDMTRRFWVSVVATAPLLLMAMGSMVPALRDVVPAGIRSWVELALATPVVLWGGWPFFVRFKDSLTNRSPNMFTLIGLGVGVAYVYSVVAVLAP